MARPDSKSLNREIAGFPPHRFTPAVPKDTVYNAVIAAQSTPPFWQHHHGLPEMGMGSGGGQLDPWPYHRDFCSRLKEKPF